MGDLYRDVPVHKKHTQHSRASFHQNPTLALIRDCFGIL